MPKWIPKLFRHSKNKDPAKFVGAESPSTGYGYRALGINPDGTLKDFATQKYKQCELYSLTLARTCINKIATEVSKAVPKLNKPNARVEYVVSKFPNEIETASQFLYHLCTLLLTDNNAYIIPIYNNQGRGDYVDGLFVAGQNEVEIVDVHGELWLLMDMGDGNKQAVQYSKCAHLKRMQYQDKLYGENNDIFKKMGYLYEEQLQRSLNSLANNDMSLRWIAKLNATVLDMDDIEAQQDIFQSLNFMSDNRSVMMYDDRFASIEQVKKQYDLLSADDIKVMQTSAYNYWGVSEAVLQNRYSESEWYAFYQSAVEPILVQIGEGLTKVMYSRSQIIYGEQGIKLNSLQYSSVKSRIDVAFGAYDRGMTTLDDSLGILNLPPLPDGQGNKRYIRGEYYEEGREDRREEDDGNQKKSDNEPQPESGAEANRE